MVTSTLDQSKTQLAVCAYFVAEITAALTLEGQSAIAVAPFRGRCDERPKAGHCPRPEDIGAPLLCGSCAGDSSNTILPFEWCFELLMGPDNLSSLLSQGCHLLTPSMLLAWPENVEHWNFTAEAARDYFYDSVSRFVVLDAGVAPISSAAIDEITAYSGRPVEIISINLDYLRLMLRHILDLIVLKAEPLTLKSRLTMLQGLNADLGMAYDLLARMPPFADEAAAINGMLELFAAFFAPRALHFLPLSGEVRSLPDSAVLNDRLSAHDWSKEGGSGVMGADSFHILVCKDQQTLGRVVVEGLSFPSRRDDYLNLASFVTPVLALFILNGRIHERLREAKKEREQRERDAVYHAFFDGSRDGILIADTVNVNFHHANQAICDMLGYANEELLQLSLKDIRPPAEQGDLGAEFERYLFSDEKKLVEAPLLRKDAAVFTAEIAANRIQMGEQAYWVGMFRDISARKEAECRLRLNAAVFDNALEGIVITDQDKNILDVNYGFTAITGLSRQEVLGKAAGRLLFKQQDELFYADVWQELTEKGHWSGDIWNRRNNGEAFAERLTITTVLDDQKKVVNYIGVFSDITFAKLHEQQLERIAHYDALTGIPNRVLLADRMKQAIAHAKRERKMLGVCYLDLDGFKAINDTLGHQVGDHVLIEIARRIGGAIREGDTVARLGGDEFVVLLTNLSCEKECIATLTRLHEAISHPVLTQGHSCSLSVSTGVSLYPEDNNDPEVLLRHADQAMYVAKESGKNRYHLFDPRYELQSRAFQNAMLRIEQGLDNHEFELYYQPKVDLHSRQVIGAEALIRWNHPERGILLPKEFLSDIRNSELEIRLGEWVVDTALKQLMLWCEAGHDIAVSVNIAACHLRYAGFVAFLKQRLEDYPNLPSGRFQIEILETAALEDLAEVSATIASCRMMGTCFALDDFGTGYSSLTYLHRLPIDTLKIDQSFFRDMLVDKGDKAIVQGVIALAKAFGLKTVAEGMESAEHLGALLAMGCEFGQGYAVARPLPASQFIAVCQSMGS